MGNTLPYYNSICLNDPEKKYKRALATEQVQIVRLASLDENDNLVVRSIKDIEFSDEAFRDVGICSYTWGFDRVPWTDSETGLTWEISNRCEAMCRAALKFYPRVWIDGICMIQSWPGHIRDNMKIMGRLYWHGNVVPEMVLYQLSPEYPLRGWVQQEISFTNLSYCITPLKQWFDSNQDVVATYVKYLDSQKEQNENVKVERPGPQTIDIITFNKAVSDSIPFFNVLSRATEGRTSLEAMKLKAKIADLLSRLQVQAFMFGSFGDSTLIDILSLEIPLVGKLERENNTLGLNSTSIQSFRTGFFRFNNDRQVAAFSLASYVAKEDDLETFVKSLYDNFVPSLVEGTVINGNPGAWCTGLSPVFTLRTVEWLKACEEMLDKSNFMLCQERDNIDLFISILHGCSPDHLKTNYDYVIGYAVLEDKGIHSCHFGVKKRDDLSTPVRGLISANIPIEAETKNETYYASCLHIINQHLKMELGIRAIALLNSSWHVKSANNPEMIFPTDSQTLRMLDLESAPPFGEFRSAMKKAILNFLLALGCAAAIARDSPKIKKDDAFDAQWGDQSMEHINL